MEAHRKRALEHDDSFDRAKMPRLGARARLQAKKTSFIPTATRSPYDYGFESQDSFVSDLHGTNCVPGAEATPRSWDAPTEVRVVPGASTKKIESFTESHMEEYRKAEALRLLFLTNGLHYKKPRSYRGFISEDVLAPYMAQWEECLARWSSRPIAISPGASLTNKTGTVFGQSLFSQQLDKKHRSPIDEEASPISIGRSSMPGPVNSTEGSPSLNFPTLNSEPAEPPTKVTAAQWGVSTFPNDHLRQAIQFEVRRQLDCINARAIRSHVVPDQKPAPASSPMRGRSPIRKQRSRCHRKRSNTRLVPSPRFLDELTQFPEMVPVRRLADGTLEYVDSTEEVHVRGDETAVDP